MRCYDPSFNRSREIPPEAVGGGIFDSFSPLTFDRSDTEVDNDVISGISVKNFTVS